MCILHINFCAISFNRSRDIIILKIFEKTLLQHLLESHVCTNYINVISYCSHIAYNFYKDSMQWQLRYDYHKSFRKSLITAPSTALYVPKLHHCYF